MLLEGELDYYGGSGWDVFPTIGEKSIYGELEAEFGEVEFGRDPSQSRFRVMLGADPIGEGRISEMHVGGIDVLEKLRDLDGRTVALSVERVDGRRRADRSADAAADLRDDGAAAR